MEEKQNCYMYTMVSLYTLKTHDIYEDIAEDVEVIFYTQIMN